MTYELKQPKMKGGKYGLNCKKARRYIIDFYDTHGKRRWITMPKGTTKKKAKEK